MVSISKRQVRLLADTIASARPAPDRSLEQFLMTPDSMAIQVEALEQLLGTCDHLMLIGDDDHLSLLFGHVFAGCAITVYEYDQRIVDSINTYAKSHSLRVTAVPYDVRSPFPVVGAYQMFYINPPYSSKTKGLGIKVWLRRALEGVEARGFGVLVVPQFAEQEALPWVGENLLETQAFLNSAGCIFDNLDSRVSQFYEGTHDKYLVSTNYLVRRVNDAPIPEVEIPSDDRLYR